MDPKFIAGAISIEKTLEQNLESAERFLGPNLNLTTDHVDAFFSGFRQSTSIACIDSPKEDQTALLKCRRELYDGHFEYKQMFNKFFQ